MTGTSQPAGPSSDRFFRVNIRVHFADTDAAGVVWFANFFRFFEEAEDELFRALGKTRMEILREVGVMMPRVDASCRFRSPAHAEEVLEIGIAVESRPPDMPPPHRGKVDVLRDMVRTQTCPLFWNGSAGIGRRTRVC
jgi:hypothetical protein